ncbi:DUF6333 family protein [Streptomyces sp. NPDC059649]|uniref:DUF6333 family protein n=1 Tax=Streptomyces sp. NPDC059649 TaxID=3346895 RepID=UPI0036AEB1C8
MTTDNSFWTIPAETMVRGSVAHCNLTVLQPPFTIDVADFPANDPVQAAEFAGSLSTVAAVMEDLGLRPVSSTPNFRTRADLDIVQAGVWGDVLAVSDPAWADDGNGNPLLSEAKGLREKFPDARIVGRVEVHCGAEHTEDLVWLPDGTMFHASGWPGDEPFVVTGDPEAVLSCLGITRDMLDDIDAYIDLDDEPNQIDWGALAGLALGEAGPWGIASLNMSSLRVRHTEDATSHMEELYFITG